MEPHPVWEYPCLPLTHAHEIFFFDEQAQNLENNFSATVNMPLVLGAGELNGVVLWQEVDYDEADAEISLRNGLVGEVVRGQRLVWAENHKQAVHILDRSVLVAGGESVECRVSFNAGLGRFDVGFKVVGSGGGSTAAGCVADKVAQQVLV